MSAEKQSIVLTYTPLQGGNGESRWIRLEQVQATLPGPSVAAAAGLIDLLYYIEPCDEGLGGGGKAADEENGPDAERMEEELAILLEDAGQCGQGYWLAAVNVYRTHEEPGYVLKSGTATVETVEPIVESYRQVVDVNGPLIEMERPYKGNLQGIPAGVNWTVRGATVNLDRPLHERLILRYDTWHEYVTLRVPTQKTDDGEEYEPAAVVAFWGELAAECELEPPEPESGEDRAERERLCKKRRKEPDEPADCWKIIKHFKRCECSRKRMDEWEEQVPAPCDGYRAGAGVGIEEKFDGFAWCEDDGDDELQDPEFYRKHCCREKPGGIGLPRCKRSYAVYAGGHEIEGGPERWKNIYGDDVIMTPVLPKDGACGEQITEWNIPQKNCCEDVIPMSPSPDNPERIDPGYVYPISVRDGKPGEDRTWEAWGGVAIEEAGGGTTWKGQGNTIHIRAGENVCPNPVVRVDDGCFPLEMRFHGPDAPGPAVSPRDVVAASPSRFSVGAAGGVRPYMWQVSGNLRLLGWSADGSTAYVETPGDERSWCVETVTAVDQCGREAVCTVRNAAAGSWRQVYGFDPANPPGAPFPYTGPGNASDPSGGYYVRVQSGSAMVSPGSTPRRCTDDIFGFPPGTNVLMVETDAGNVRPRSWLERCEATAADYYGGGVQISNGCCTFRGGDLRYYAIGYVTFARELYQWICGA